MPVACLRRRILPALTAALLTLGTAKAQDRTRFDPVKHLPGYQQEYLGEHSDLYDFAPYEEASGKQLSAAEIEDLREAWRVEHERVTARVARLAANPGERFLVEVERTLRRSRLFRAANFRRVDTFDPFFFFVERSSRPQPVSAQRMADVVGPWAQTLEQVFREEYALPLGLQRHPERAACAIVVLDSQASYERYAQAAQSYGIHSKLAHYDAERCMVVTHRDALLVEDQARARRPILHALANALQHAWATEDMPAETWFHEGLAGYLSCASGAEPRTLREHPVDGEAVEVLVPFTRPPWRKTFVLPVEELLALRGDAAAVGVIRTKARTAGYEVADQRAAQLLYAQSNLLVSYLHHGEDGGHREDAREYLRSTLAGSGGPEGLRKAFAGVDMTALDDGFVSWVRQAFEVAHPGGLRTLDATRPNLGGISAGTGAATPFDPATIALPADDGEVRFALVLDAARAGAYGRAARELGSWIESGTQGELADRVERELQRLEGMIALRQRFFEHLRNTDKKLKLERGKAWLLAKVEAIDAEGLTLGSNRLDVDRLALDEIDGVELADLMRDRGKYGFPHEWLMAYPYVLAGETKGERGLFDDGADSRALERDASDDYPQRLLLATCARALSDLAVGFDAADPTAARAAFERARGLLADEAPHPLVASRRDALLGLARFARAAEFDNAALDELLHGRVETLDGDGVRVTYDFESGDEAADFLAGEPTYGLDAGMAKEGRTTVVGAFEVKKGSFCATGQASTRHVLELERCTVRYSVVVNAPASTKPVFFQVGLADDGAGNFAACTGLGSLLVIDDPSGTFRQERGSPPAQKLGKTYRLELRDDGSELTSKLDGKPAGRLALDPRVRGHVFLSCASESPLEIQQLVIEGTWGPTSRAAFRSAWVERSLTEAGLDGE